MASMFANSRGRRTGCAAVAAAMLLAVSRLRGRRRRARPPSGVAGSQPVRSGLAVCLPERRAHGYPRREL